MLTKYWEIEKFPEIITDPKNVECESIFRNTHPDVTGSREKDGYRCTPLVTEDISSSVNQEPTVQQEENTEEENNNNENNCSKSKAVYNAAVYLRVVDSSGRVKLSLMMAKSRVAPIKSKLTIPKLELCGVALGINILDNVLYSIRDNV
ncbi:hypothetical protein EVAR_96872_1 [Eumeta japonica]|uniref:DUF5641 domain-containing protein n=1 Tax=Eumeta variegata TaxID=151549 RepID=A0A4C1WNW3_EUMVA|nr:hypothetical protein EVAR_96872_1 [Eumeta japonica]